MRKNTLIPWDDLQQIFPPERWNDNDEFMTYCNCHSDHTASLSIRRTSDRYLFHCFAGCSTSQIIKAAGLKPADIDRNNNDQILKKITRHYKDDQQIAGAEAVQIYDYKDPEGKYLYSRIRFKLPNGSKAMRYARINYKLGSVTSYSRGCDPVPYNLPELLRSIKDGYPVYVVEGEKDVHTLREQLHYTATTAGSASDWKTEYSRFFRGASVVILPDNDKAGRDAVQKIQNDLLKYAYQVKVVYTSQQKGGDVTDYLEEGNTAEDLQKLISDQEWQQAEWIWTDRKKQTINTDLLASCIEKNEHYLIVRLPDDNRDSLFTYSKGVYTKVNRNQFIADVIRPYIPKGKATSNMMDNTMKLLLTSGSHCIEHDQLDADESVINMKNGLLDINTWELRPHRPDLLSTIQLDVEYNPNAKKMKNFDKYINDLIRDPEGNPDEEKAKVIQEYFGLVLSNIKMYTRVKYGLFLISFIGNTGKSSLLRLIDSMLGIGRTAAIDLKDLNNNSGNRFVLGRIRGKRLIECGDMSSTPISDSSIFKKLTGGDLQKIEEKGVQADYFRYSGGLVICSNQMPQFEDDQGKHIADRILMIPLQHTIIQKDSELEDRMIMEKSAVFNWFMYGLKRLSENNFEISKCGAVDDFMEEFRSGSDSLYRFISRYYEITFNTKDRIQKSVFDEHYHQWCGRINGNPKEDHVTEIRRRNIKKRMMSYGVNVNENANIGDHRNVPCYIGIKPKEDE